MPLQARVLRNPAYYKNEGILGSGKGFFFFHTCSLGRVMGWGVGRGVDSVGCGGVGWWGAKGGYGYHGY
jgi:hypothetical protein